MSSPELAAGSAGTAAQIGALGSLTALIDDAGRQLAICNACRYCEGLCPVFPALERRLIVEGGDLSQLANLCHDCRACLDACMYSPPHEFGLDLPKVFTAARLQDYREYVWPKRVPAAFRGRSGLVAGSVISVVIVLAIAVLHSGWSAITQSTGSPAAPYKLIPYGVLLGLMFAATVYGATIAAIAARNFWAATSGEDRTQIGANALVQATWQAATLSHMRGGGEDCYYPEADQPSQRRRWLHHLVSYGFGLCLIATVAAAISQDIFGQQPPYQWISVPVLSGVVGGISMLIGCTGLVALKLSRRTSIVLQEMTIKDYGLLCALAFLAASGLAVLLTRTTHVYGIMLIVHLAALIECFALAPYSKLIHVVFRFMALVRDNAELGGISNGTDSE